MPALRFFLLATVIGLTACSSQPPGWLTDELGRPGPSLCDLWGNAIAEESARFAVTRRETRDALADEIHQAPPRLDRTQRELDAWLARDAQRTGRNVEALRADLLTALGEDSVRFVQDDLGGVARAVVRDSGKGIEGIGREVDSVRIDLERDRRKTCDRLRSFFH